MLCVAGLLAAPAIADPAPPAAPSVTAQASGAPAAVTTESDADLDKVVCRSLEPPTGTRLGTRRVCQTQRQWQDQEEQARHALEKEQNNRGIVTSGG
jgi:hypothetical protein